MCVALSVLELLCRPGWPKTCRDLTVSASQVLELKPCTTTPGFLNHYLLFETGSFIGVKLHHASLSSAEFMSVLP